MYQKLFRIQEEVFRTIASQKRLEIIQLLRSRELTVSEITDMLGISQTNVSQHLSELRRAKIVTVRKEGTSSHYRLADKRIAQACELIKTFLQDQHKLDSEMTEMMQDNTRMFPVAVDPVCGMRISIAYAGGREEHGDRLYYFCAQGCHEKFVKNPDIYVRGGREAVKREQFTS